MNIRKDSFLTLEKVSLGMVLEIGGKKEDDYKRLMNG